MKKNEVLKKTLLFTTIMILCSSGVLITYHVSAQQEKEYFFEVMITYTTRYTDGGVWEAVVAELDKIGIKAEIETIDFSTWIDRCSKVPATYKEGGWDATTCNMGWGTDPSLIEGVYGSLKRRPFGWNIMGYANGRVDDLFTQAVSTMDLDARQEAYENIAEIIDDDMPMAPLLWPIHPTPSRMVMWKEGVDLVWWSYAETWYRQEDNERISIAMGNDVKHQIPSLTMEGGSNQFVSLVFDSLIRLDGDLKPVPYLAESWEHSDDYLTWTFNLRDNVYWHDGEKFTAEDVVFTFEATGDPELGAVWAYSMEAVESVEAPNDYTVVIKLNRIVADFMTGNQLPTLGIAPKHLLEDVPYEDWPTCAFSTTDTIGTGPYMFVEHKEGDYTRFVANPNYFLGEPPIKEIYFRVIPDKATALVALEKGDVDVLEYRGAAFTGEEIEHMKSLPELRVPQWPAFNVYGLWFNVNHPQLSNKYVRHAIAHAIPREHICDDILGGTGQPANQPFVPGYLGFNEELPPIEYDIDKAKELMEKAGYKYDYITPKPIPMSAYYLPAVGGLVVGAVVAALVTWMIFGRRKF